VHKQNRWTIGFKSKKIKLPEADCSFSWKKYCFLSFVSFAGMWSVKYCDVNNIFFWKNVVDSVVEVSLLLLLLFLLLFILPSFHIYHWIWQSSQFTWPCMECVTRSIFLTKQIKLMLHANVPKAFYLFQQFLNERNWHTIHFATFIRRKIITALCFKRF